MADLSVREAARLLQVPEKTVYRWVREGSIPHDRLRDEIRFNRVELQEWAQARGRPLHPGSLDAAPAAPADAGGSLADALARGGIARDVPGATREAVLAAVGGLPGLPEGIDRALLVELLASRERLGSTGLGGGIAIPHPRDPVVLGVREPRVLLALLATPVDFGAPDGRLVSTLFLILSPSVQGHLDTLSRLAFVLHDPEVKRRLEARAPDDALLAAVRAAEPRAAAAPPDVPDDEEDR
jgi:PTS system nitrogen regulatory IIA component